LRLARAPLALIPTPCHFTTGVRMRPLLSSGVTRAFSPVLAKKEVEQYLIHTHRSVKSAVESTRTSAVSGSLAEEEVDQPGMASPEDKSFNQSSSMIDRSQLSEESSTAEDLRRENEELRMQVQALRDERVYTAEQHAQVIATVVKERNELAEQLKAAQNDVSTGIGDSSPLEESDPKLPDSGLSNGRLSNGRLSTGKDGLVSPVSAVLVERPLLLQGINDCVLSPPNSPESPSPRNAMENSVLASRAQLWELQGALRKALQSKPISKPQVVVASEQLVKSPPPPPPPSPYLHIQRTTLPARSCSPPATQYLACSPGPPSIRSTVGGGELAAVHAAVRGRGGFRPPRAPGSGTPTGPLSPSRTRGGATRWPLTTSSSCAFLATCPTPARAKVHRHAPVVTKGGSITATALSPSPVAVRASSACRSAQRHGLEPRSPSPVLRYAASPGPVITRMAMVQGSRCRTSPPPPPIAGGSVVVQAFGASGTYGAASGALSPPMSPSSSTVLIRAHVDASHVAAAGGAVSPGPPTPGASQRVVRVRHHQEPVQRFLSAPVSRQLSASLPSQRWGSPSGGSPTSSYRGQRTSPTRGFRAMTPLGRAEVRSVSRPAIVLTASEQPAIVLTASEQQPLDTSISTVIIATAAEVELEEAELSQEVDKEESRDDLRLRVCKMAAVEAPWAYRSGVDSETGAGKATQPLPRAMEKASSARRTIQSSAGAE